MVSRASQLGMARVGLQADEALVPLAINLEVAEVVAFVAGL